MPHARSTLRRALSSIGLVLVLVLAPALAAADKPRWQTLPLPPAMPKAAATGHVEVAGGAQIYYATYGKRPRRR